jgi:hypothetical protein
MFIAKWGTKLGTPDALENDPATWTGMSYLKGGGVAAGAGIVLNMVRPGWGQRVVEGGLQLLLYKAIQNHVIPKSTWATTQFGGANESSYQPGDVETNSAGEPFVLGQDGQTWIPLDSGDSGVPALAGPLEVPGRLGDAFEPPGRMGLGFGQDTSAAFARRLFNR